VYVRIVFWRKVSECPRSKEHINDVGLRLLAKSSARAIWQTRKEDFEDAAGVRGFRALSKSFGKPSINLEWFYGISAAVENCGLPKSKVTVAPFDTGLEYVFSFFLPPSPKSVPLEPYASLSPFCWLFSAVLTRIITGTTSRSNAGVAKHKNVLRSA
jgi:hypothetical protein